MTRKLYEKARAGDVTGSNVYRPYRPQQAGVIVTDLDKGTTEVHNRRVRVRWLKGTEEQVRLGDLNDFDLLIEDHRKKLQTHEAVLEKLKVLMI